MLIRKSLNPTRTVAVTAMLSAVSAVLQFLEFPLPFLIPSFVEFDFSDLPALIGSFSMGPLLGVIICLVKNVIHLLFTTTAGVGELANFLLSASFVFVAGVVYHFKRTRTGALLGSLLGAVCMALVAIPVNYFITYPFYFVIFAPEAVIISAYQALLPSVSTTMECLLIFNTPFNLGKGIITAALAFGIYKHISPLIKGRK